MTKKKPKEGAVGGGTSSSAAAPRSSWFEGLEEELVQRAQQAQQETAEERKIRERLNKEIITDFWNVWKKFYQLGALFVMDPPYQNWAQFIGIYPFGDWTWRNAFDPSSVSLIQLGDRTPEQNRVGDSLRVEYHRQEKEGFVRVVFEYTEGEHYYKYSGWKRIYVRHTLYDSTLKQASLTDLHKVFKDVVSVWYESHVKRDRGFLLHHLKRNYEKFESFSQ